MLYIGSHVGFKKDSQLIGSLNEALSYNSNAFMFYTGAPQNSSRSKIEDGYTIEAMMKMKEVGFNLEKVIVHAPYIINLANGDKDKFKFSCDFLMEEIHRCEDLGVKYMVLHPGSHIGQGRDEGIRNIIKGLNYILGNVKTDVVILLETMAGKGTEIGYCFLDLKEIIDGCEYKDNLGICMDTCHLNDAGYDLSNFDLILDEFDNMIGIDKIKCIHINDSKNIINSHKDRHENIGFGTIGFDNLIKIIYNERLGEIPRILETPYVDKEFAPYKYEIEMIRNKKFNNKLLDDVRKQ